MISPTVLNTPTVLKISPHIYHDIPHGTEHPTVLKISPHSTHDIPHGTEHPHGTAHTLYDVGMHCSSIKKFLSLSSKTSTKILDVLSF